MVDNNCGCEPCPFTVGDRVTVQSNGTPHGDTGTVMELGGPGLCGTVLVRWDNTGESWTPWELLHEPGRQNVIDVRRWPRLAEVDAYARMRVVDRATALRELVWLGLDSVRSEPLGD